jgi:GTP cyclohydrolase I
LGSPSALIPHKPGTDLVTSRMLGCFRDNPLTRQEFLGMPSE